MLKERLKGIIIGVIVTLMLISPISAFAKTIQQAITVSYNNIKIYVDGKEIQTSKEPFVYEGTTYLPVRAVAEALGKEVNWDGANNAVIIGKAPDNISQAPTTQPQQTEQPTVTLDMNNPIIVAAQNAPKSGFVVKADAKTEYTKYETFIDYLKATGQYNESLAYDATTISTDYPKGRTTNYYMIYYYNEFLHAGMTYIPYSTGQVAYTAVGSDVQKIITKGCTVVATYYDKANNNLCLELKKDNQVYLNAAAASLKVGKEITFYEQITDTTAGKFVDAIKNQSIVNGDEILTRWVSSNNNLIIQINGHDFMTMESIKSIMNTTPIVENITELNEKAVY